MGQPNTTEPLSLVEPIARPHHRRSRSKLRKLGRRLGRIVNWRILFTTLISVALVVVVGGLVLTADALNRVNASVTNLNRVVSALETKPGTELTLADFQRLKSSVNDLRFNLDTARRQTGFLRPFSSVNADLTATFQALDIAEELALAVDDVLTGLEPTLFFLVSGDERDTVITQISSSERVIELLRIGRSRFVSASSHLVAARSLLDKLDLANVSPSLLLNLTSLERYQSQFQEIDGLLVNAPELLAMALGVDAARTYLILAQNSDELRPSGGFISTYGWMTVRNGRIVNYDYSPSTVLSPNPPDTESPFEVPDWWIRYDRPVYAAWDGSWYADFPSTAEMARWYYDSGNNPQSPVDGVIAIDIVGFEYLLGALGGVTVAGYDIVVTPQNFRQVVYDIRAFGEGELAHKRFVAALFRQIFSDWQSVERDQARSTALLGATLRALQEKQIMLYLVDEQLQSAVKLLGWAGAQDAAAGHDYLMVADANLGNKSNRSIIRQLTYDVNIQPDGTLKSRAAVSYDYPRSVAENDPAINPEYHGPLDYNNLVQVYVPAGSILTESANIPSRLQTIEDKARSVFVTNIEIRFDSGERFQFSYTTPPLIEEFGRYKRYRLLLQKQPGMIGELVSVQVSLPQGVTVVNTTPSPVASYNLDRPILEFRVELVTDQWVEVIYR